MSGERRPWVGDLVHDEDADRRGIVTDVRGGAVWVLRPESGPGRWTSRQPERLTVVTPRERRRGQL
ncbi:hypothetical protein ACWGJW_21530 [Streptomyces nigrescens]|uniref:hypothetical protein n=1 Tax=Streptomyces sp. Isolate_219 TaxID=2950110 RepID=UPI0021C9DE03|nr:hypothetical protein [Streptomyces sp. Isolate_219]MCR8578078.1 hypothetical protein [Streptomyces sp. Isolate_219]